MTLDDADDLLSQWGRWASNELKKLDASKSKWQMDYRPAFDPENDADECHAAPDELQMLDVDTALGMVKIEQPRYFFMLRGRYLHGESYAFYQLDAAKRAFITEYASPLEEKTVLDMLTVDKRTATI